MANNIYKAINEVMKEIGAVGKNQKNSQQGFMYRGIDAVMNAINPALTNHGVFVVPEVLEQTREERTTSKGNLLIYSICKIKFSFFAEDGSHIEAITIGEGMDSGDKATNKAMSIAFKYACFQVFCIPTEEMVDPDAECHEVKPKKEAEKSMTDEEKNAQMMEEVGKELISAVQVKALTKKCNDENVPLEFLLNAYKIKDLTEMNQAQFRNVNDKWTTIKEKANK
jgi:hypothetical protein